MAALFEFMSGTKMLHVPYKSEGQALTDLMTGHISILFHVAAAVMPLAEAGKLRAMGVTSLKRWDLLPDLPSIAEAGIPRLSDHRLAWGAGTRPDTAIHPGEGPTGYGERHEK